MRIVETGASGEDPGCAVPKTRATQDEAAAGVTLSTTVSEPWSSHASRGPVPYADDDAATDELFERGGREDRGARKLRRSATKATCTLSERESLEALPLPHRSIVVGVGPGRNSTNTLMIKHKNT